MTRPKIQMGPENVSYVSDGQVTLPAGLVGNSRLFCDSIVSIRNGQQCADRLNFVDDVGPGRASGWEPRPWSSRCCCP